MPAIGLAEAARITGRNRSTIHRAMQTGRLSYTKSEAGERRIDVAELERVFGPITQIVSMVDRNAGNGAANDASNATHRAEIELLITAQRETIAQQAETIRDLRIRLDDAATERRQERQLEAEERRRLLALLVDRRPWWRRWFR